MSVNQISAFRNYNDLEEIDHELNGIFTSGDLKKSAEDNLCRSLTSLSIQEMEKNYANARKSSSSTPQKQNNISPLAENNSLPTNTQIITTIAIPLIPFSQSSSSHCSKKRSLAISPKGEACKTTRINTDQNYKMVG